MNLKRVAIGLPFAALRGYLYDKNSNRTSMDKLNVQPKLPTSVVSATYNEANQMQTFQPEGDVEWSMIYDENGNLTSITNSCGTTTYTWDARNRLVEINGFTADCSPLTANFKYDALGRRIEKTINGRTIQYLYDGLDIVQEIENGIVMVNYIRTLNIDEPLARITSDGTIRYYHADALGSIIALTDDLGQVRTQYNYSPFGETELMGEPSDNPFQYTGRENDGTGLYYYRFRYYSPELKRFISEDPIGLLGGDVNFYVYVWNSPIKHSDLVGYGTFYCIKKSDGHLECGFKHDPPLPTWLNKAVNRTLPYIIGLNVLITTENPALARKATIITEIIMDFIFDEPIEDPFLGIEWYNPPELNKEESCQKNERH